MVTASLLSVVLGAILVLSDTTAQLAPNDDERALMMQETRTGVETLTKEVRQATAVSSVSSNAITFSIGSRTITYDCTPAQAGFTGRTRCTRQEAGGAPTTAISHVLNQANGVPVFTQTGNYVSVKVQVAAAGERLEGHKHTITLDDGAYMRNLP